ncbi:MAG: beta-hydroxyacyl-ACP dehydratase [Phycisphaerales bacterium]
MWIDRILEIEPGRRLVAIKNVSLAEEHLHDHFEADVERGLAALPVMPGSLMIEGMAQTAGVLVGHAGGFKEKVVLAKVSRAEIDADATAGTTIRYTAEVERMDASGASTKGLIELIEPAGRGGGSGAAREIGRVDLLFSFLDQNMAGQSFPKHNFVFGEGFKTLLRMSGIE